VCDASFSALLQVTYIRTLLTPKQQFLLDCPRASFPQRLMLPAIAPNMCAEHATALYV
jgi:hypothetical protein